MPRGRRRLGLPFALAFVIVAYAAGFGTGLVVLPFVPAHVDLAAVNSVDAVHAGVGTAASFDSAAFFDSGRGTRGAPGVVAAAPAADAAADLVAAAPAMAVSDVDPDALDAAGLTGADRSAGLLSTEVPPNASGGFVVVPGAVPAPGQGPVHTVRVEVEVGLPVDPTLFAATVMATLNDPRGWGAGGALTFARTDGEAEIRVVLASPATVDAMCAPLETVGEFSCARSGSAQASINFRRWSIGASSFGTDRTLYRHYVINHEVGHLLGHGHEECPGPGQPAPLMQQQSVGVAPCVPSGFPNP